MKPFDLKRALAGAVVVTRDGREVSELHFFSTATKEDYPILASIDEEVYSFTVHGKEFTSLNNKEMDSELDLFMEE
jgi:hypothetical protein